MPTRLVGLLLGTEAPAMMPYGADFSFLVFQQGLVGSFQFCTKSSEKREFCPIYTSVYNPTFALFRLISADSSGVEISLVNPAWPNFVHLLSPISGFTHCCIFSFFLPSIYPHLCVCTEMMKFCCFVVPA